MAWSLGLFGEYRHDPTFAEPAGPSERVLLQAYL
jgi:hypothetical protein